MENADDNVAWVLGGHLAALSVMAFGGGAIILAPDIQRFVVDVNHWLSNEAFLAAYTIAQAAPGPNMLFVTLVGWYAAGLLGAVTATAAIVVPPAILTLAVLRASPARVSPTRGSMIKAAVLPLSVGLMLATGYSLARAADHSWGSAALTAVTVGVFLYRKLNPLWLIAAGAVAGMLGWV